MNASNVGRTDAAIRMMLGVALLGIAAAFNQRPLLALGSGFLAIILLATGLFRVCPLYTLFKHTSSPRSSILS
ncbi:MAG: DUF2892 domain-containing protein [Gemmatimonadales bacterium]|nr:DUF2892 domain-containing protein [Gemmatimonadales bacterium]